MRYRTSARAGFTLIEIMVVLFILGLIMAILVPSVNYYRESAKRDSTVASLRALKQAVETYNNDFGAYPKKPDDLLKPPQGMPPLIEAQGGLVPKDGWRRDFVYKVPGKGHPYDLYSYGKKGPEEATPEDYLDVWKL